MNINISYDSTLGSAPSGFTAAVQAACNFFDTTFTNNISVNITFSYAAIGGGLAQSQSYYYSGESYSSVVSALKTNATGIASLAGEVIPTTDPFGAGGTLNVNTAEAKALGLSSYTGTDGICTLGSSYSWNFSTTGAAVSGEFSAVGALDHEISEVLGRGCGSDGSLSDTPDALFRYSAPGVVDTSSSYAGAYFSVNGGVTNLAQEGEQGSDLADWGGSVSNDALGYASTGVTDPFSATDITVMNALGYKTAVSPAPALTISSAGGLTNQTTQTISGTIDVSDAGLMVSIYDGSTLLGTTTSTAGGTWSASVSLLGTQGAQSITAKATNAAGTGTSSAVTYTLDTIAPTLAVTSAGGLTNQTTQTISGTIDAADAGLTVSIYDGTTLLGTVTPAANGAWSKSVTLLSTQGGQSITAKATDAAGNVGTSSAATYTLDTIAPTLAITSTGGLTNQTTQTISGTIDAADAGLTVSIYDGSTLLGTTTSTAGGAWTATVSLLSSQGAQSITARATDAAGNVGTRSAAT